MSNRSSCQVIVIGAGADLQKSLSDDQPSISSFTCSFLWSPYVIGQTIIFCPVVSFFFLSFFFLLAYNLSGRKLDVYHTSTHGVALVRIQNACLKRAARGSLKIHFGTIAQHCRAVSSQLRHVSTIGKNLLNIDTPTCPHNMVNFGLLTAEICWRVWCTPANFNLNRGATYFRQGDHHVGHWPTFQLIFVLLVRECCCKGDNQVNVFFLTIMEVGLGTGGFVTAAPPLFSDHVYCGHGRPSISYC